jgi:hypothetical protein
MLVPPRCRVSAHMRQRRRRAVAGKKADTQIIGPGSSAVAGGRHADTARRHGSARRRRCGVGVGPGPGLARYGGDDPVRSRARASTRDLAELFAVGPCRLLVAARRGAGSVIVRGRPRVGPAETAKTACDAVVEKPCKIGKHSSSLLQVCQLLSFESRSERPRTPTRRERAVVAVRLNSDTAADADLARACNYPNARKRCVVAEEPKRDSSRRAPYVTFEAAAHLWF